MSQPKPSKLYQYNSSSSLEELLAKVSRESDTELDTSNSNGLTDNHCNDGSNATTYSGELSQNGDVEQAENSMKIAESVDSKGNERLAMGKVKSKLIATETIMTKSLFVNVGSVQAGENKNSEAQQQIVETSEGETEYDFAINQVVAQTKKDASPASEQRYPHQVKAEAAAKNKVYHGSANDSKVVHSITARTSHRRTAPFKSIKDYEQCNKEGRKSNPTADLMTRSTQPETNLKPFPLTLIRRSSTGGNLAMTDTNWRSESFEALNTDATNGVAEPSNPSTAPHHGNPRKAYLPSPHSSKRSLNRCPSTKNSLMRNYNSTCGLNGLHMVYDSNKSLSERNVTASLDRRVMKNSVIPARQHNTQDRRTGSGKGLHRCQTSPLILEPSAGISHPQPSPRLSYQSKPSGNITNNANASPQNTVVKQIHKHGYTLPSHQSFQCQPSCIQQHHSRAEYPRQFNNQVAFKRFFDSIKKYYPMTINKEYHDETNVPDVVLDTIGQAKAAENGATSIGDDSKSDAGSSIRSTASAYWPPHLKNQRGNNNILSYRPKYSQNHRVVGSHTVLKPMVRPRIYKI